MPEKRRLIISWILVIIWASFIFFMSNMDTNDSNTKSKLTINEVIEKTVQTTNKFGITNKHPSESKMKQVIEKLNYPLRKIAHASEYFILTILLIRALKNSRVSGNKVFLFTILICFLYACTDEYHQTFVNGRTGQFSDVLIDSFGTFIGIMLYITLKNVKKVKKTRL